MAGGAGTGLLAGVFDVDTGIEQRVTDAFARFDVEVRTLRTDFGVWQYVQNGS